MAHNCPLFGRTSSSGTICPLCPLEKPFVLFKVLFMFQNLYLVVSNIVNKIICHGTDTEKAIHQLKLSLPASWEECPKWERLSDRLPKGLSGSGERRREEYSGKLMCVNWACPGILLDNLIFASFIS